MNILQLDSSILGENSVSRRLCAEVTSRLVVLNPDAKITYRDLAADPPRHLSARHIAVAYGAQLLDEALQADIALGEAYLTELQAADAIVIGAPMYNFTVPTQLKAWIDRVVIADKTFRYSETGAEGLLAKGKRAYIASARANAYGAGSPVAHFEHHVSYLESVLRFVGIETIEIFTAEGLAFGDDAKAEAIAAATASIAAIEA